MDIFFTDPEDLPLPPDEVRIREFTAKVYPDGQRVRVYLELTPFQRPPDAELNILNAAAITIASVSVIETMDPKMEMTMHLPGSTPSGTYQLQVKVFYRPEVDEPENGDEPAEYIPQTEFKIVDQSEISFEIN